MSDTTATQVQELLNSYDREIEGMRAEVLLRAERILEEPQNVHKFHGKIGSGYRHWADIVHAEFVSPQHFVRRWLKGVRDAAHAEIATQIAKYGRPYGGGRANRVARLIADPVIWEYTRLFHERNFYRYLRERTRKKPHDQLWSVWFGLNHTIWGLLIAPDFRNGSWRNDVSEIRRADYDYWTAGHAIVEGFINPSSSTPHRISNLDSLVQFYENILKRLSSSQYEQGIIDRYIQYLLSSRDPLHEPLLIPEVRYAGLAQKHRYRLDFVVLNPHTMELTGYELSPHSTHMAVSGITKKTQMEINRDLASRWEREMGKRRAYFDQFGIIIDTFTDSDLVDLDSCFARIRLRLSARPDEIPTIEESLRDIQKLQLP